MGKDEQVMDDFDLAQVTPKGAKGERKTGRGAGKASKNSSYGRCVVKAD